MKINKDNYKRTFNAMELITSELDRFTHKEFNALKEPTKHNIIILQYIYDYQCDKTEKKQIREFVEW